MVAIGTEAPSDVLPKKFKSPVTPLAALDPLPLVAKAKPIPIRFPV